MSSMRVTQNGAQSLPQLLLVLVEDVEEGEEAGYARLLITVQLGVSKNISLIQSWKAHPVLQILSSLVRYGNFDRLYCILHLL